MKRYLKILAISWVAIVVPMSAALWLIDPFRIFHKPWVREDYYHNDLVVQASGIINTDNFNSIILGSSMAANFSPHEATGIFGNKFVNISLDGTSLAERSVVLGYALAKKDISDVIISLDWETLDTETISRAPIEHYIYLYDDNYWNDLLIYASNPKTLRFLFCRNLLFSNRNACAGKTRDMESLVEWHSNPDRQNRFGGIENWLIGRNIAKSIPFLKRIMADITTAESGRAPDIDRAKLEAAMKKHRQVFDRYLLAYAKNHPDTNFYLFFPPYSRLQYAMLARSQPQVFHEYLDDIRFIVRDSAAYPNVRIFGFETEDFIDDIANYMDTQHYHQRFNSMMLHWMANGEHQLTPSNIEPYIEQITFRANNYSLAYIREKINSFLVN